MINLNHYNKTPIYQQIIEQILAQIACGALGRDQQLPTVRQLAKELGVNPNTVVKAYSELELNGYIYSLQGRGSFVKAGPQDDEFVQAKLDEFKEIVSILMRFGILKQDLISITHEIYESGVQTA